MGWGWVVGKLGIFRWENKAPPQHAYSCAASVADVVNGESTELDSVEVSDTVPNDDWASKPLEYCTAVHVPKFDPISKRFVPAMGGQL